MEEMKIDKIKQVAEDIVDSINKTDNDYDAREVVIKELIENELWDHYSGLPNPKWYINHDGTTGEAK